VSANGHFSAVHLIGIDENREVFVFDGLIASAAISKSFEFE
jgi:hypothetical protein